MLTVQMRPNVCPRCKDKFYDFPTSKEEHETTTCVLCGYYTYSPYLNSYYKLYLEQN